MILQKSEKNAEKRSHGGTGKIDKNLTENKLSSCIIDAAIEVHTVLGGPGLLESVYEIALAEELQRRSIPFQRQLVVPVNYKGKIIGEAFRLDLIVDNTVIVEVKATEQLHNVHSAQVLTYLRLTQKKLGLVLNFGQPLLRDGICRVVNNF
jgi:GxxExxY protein